MVRRSWKPHVAPVLINPQEQRRKDRRAMNENRDRQGSGGFFEASSNDRLKDDQER
jgi:hypothetical protein